MKERRRFPRVAYPCKINISTEEGEEEFRLHTENISSGGTRVILREKLDINTPIQVTLAIWDREIKTKGRVVWVIDINQPGSDTATLFDTGVEFTQLNQEQREMLSRLVAQVFENDSSQ